MSISRPSTELPCLEEVYVIPVAETFPKDTPSVFKPRSKNVIVNERLLGIFITRLAPASSTYGKTSPKKEVPSSSGSSSRPSSSSNIQFSFSVLF